jgi:hypothetical protein
MSSLFRSQKHVGWLFAEFAVIVLGVLTALAADEWRQGRQELEAEVGYVERLRTNLQSDTAAYRNAIENNAEARRVLQTFLDVLDDRIPFPEDHMDVPAALNGGLIARFDGPRRDTYDELINQGDLGRIRSSLIRDALAGYYGSIEGYEAVQVAEWQDQSQWVETLLIERLPPDTYRWVQGTASPDAIARRDVVDFTLDPQQVRALLAQIGADNELRNMLFRHGQILLRMADVHGGWMTDAGELLVALDAELSRLRS